MGSSASNATGEPGNCTMRGCRMSYMNHSEFALAGRIQELSIDEIEQVDGAVAPLLVAAAVIAAGVAGYYVCAYIAEHC